MRFERSRGIVVRCFLLVSVCVAAFVPWHPARADDAPCPPKVDAVYWDTGLQMSFKGEMVQTGAVSPDGALVYRYTGYNLQNGLKVVGTTLVYPFQCADVLLKAVMNEPVLILSFEIKPNNPQFSSFTPLASACDSAGGNGRVGGEDTNRIVPAPGFDRVAPAPRFDFECTVPEISAPPPSGDGSEGTATLVTVTTCYYVAHFDGSGNYMYTEFLYCTSYSYIALE